MLASLGVELKTSTLFCFELEVQKRLLHSPLWNHVIKEDNVWKGSKLFGHHYTCHDTHNFHSLLVYLSCFSLQILGLFNYIVILNANLMLLLPQANGWTCVDFGCTHPIDGLFWSLPIYLLGFFSKYECWVIDFIMLLLSFYFFDLYHKVSYHQEMWKHFVWLVFKMKFVL